MPEITDLKASIIQKAHAEGRLRLERAKADMQAVFDSEKEALQLAKEVKFQGQLADMEVSYQRERQQLEHQLRQSTLAAKQKVLQELFAEAENRMVNWSQEEHLAFFKSVMAAYPGPVTVAFGETTAACLSPETFRDLQATFPLASFQEESLVHQAGFVLRTGKIEMNYLYQDLLASIWETESYRLASDIFARE